MGKPLEITIQEFFCLPNWGFAITNILYYFRTHTFFIERKTPFSVTAVKYHVTKSDALFRRTDDNDFD